MYKIAMMVSMVFCACQSVQDRTEKNDLPGIYVRSFAHEFAKGTDTVYVRTEDGMHYFIDRGSSFQRIQNDQVLPMEHVQEHWSGEYKEEQHAVIENRTGKVIRLDGNDARLYVGGSGYERVK